jgi:2-keto-4-pentenoate hydratase
MTTPFDAGALARALLHARSGGAPADAARWPVPDAAAAYRVQAATLRTLGPVGGWKVGARSPDAEPTFAPLPQSGVLPSGAAFDLPPRALRIVELEIAVRLKRDLVPLGQLLPPAEIAAAIEGMLPAIELVDTRWAEALASPPLAQLADLQSHAALVVGAAVPVPASGLPLDRARARLWIGDHLDKDVAGGHPSPDAWRLLAHLARHAEAAGLPLRAGQVLTLGSLTGLTTSRPGTPVRGEVEGVGEVALRT